MEFVPHHLHNSDNPKPQFKPTSNYGCLVLVVLVSLLIFSKCKSSGGESTSLKSDTIKTVCLYIRPLDRALMLDYVIRITKDTVKLVDGKVKNLRDSLFFVPFIDTVRTPNGKPSLDSLGKPKLALAWQPHPKALIVTDFKANIPLQ